MAAAPPVKVVDGEEELGPQRWCRGCDEFWPVTDEFWDWERTAKTFHWKRLCRACDLEQKARYSAARRERIKADPAALEQYRATKRDQRARSKAGLIPPRVSKPRPPEGPRLSPEGRARVVEANRKALAKRWTPEARAQMGERTRERFARMTTEQRDAFAASVRKAMRRQANAA
jgi:hypothetical protein